ncbi:MAG: endopeptidase La [Pseudomonadota bacterium]
MVIDSIDEKLTESQNENDGVNEHEMLPTELCILPLSERPFFPPQTLPILMNEEVWQDALELISNDGAQTAGLVLIKNNHPDTTDISQFHTVGTIARVHHPVVSGGKIQFIAEGLQRFRIVKWLTESPPFIAKVAYSQEPEYKDQEQLKAYAMAIINTLKELMPLNPLYSEELKFFLNKFSPNEPSPLTDFAAGLTTSTRDELQDVLEAVHLKKRMEKVLILIKKELDLAKLQAKIQEKVEDTLNEHQRSFFLREQLKAIQKELGIAKDDRTADLETFQKRLQNKTIPQTAQEKISDEMQKLRVLETGSPEYAITRNYLDVVSDLPWGIESKDNLDLKRARCLLEKHHASLEDVKDRIIEFLAVGALKGKIAGSIILLVGPPGVGKTSIGRSIAEALERKFYRFSLGGLRDESEIKGHRRTYVGAMPGRIIQALRESQTSNPVIMLDEIDKVGSSYQGDPASALLEVLDPEQNDAFLDHYLDIRFDLSKVLFIATANQLDTIPAPLLDRMEEIRLSGYITAEKMTIAKVYLWPKHLEQCGLKSSQITINKTVFKSVIESYAREAGVRSLDKLLGRIARKSVTKISLHQHKKIEVNSKNLTEFLGPPYFIDELPNTGIGIITGLAWTALGGESLNVEAVKIFNGERGFKLTGSLGDIMKESAEIAYSYVCANAAHYGVCDNYFQDSMIHLHVPQGATPKDGPSAGITMATAILSLAKKHKIKSKIAMTGELTLTGQILAVGGIREKIIAARRAKIKTIILPNAVRGAHDELPEHIKENLTFHFVSQFNEIVELLFIVPNKK